MTSLRGLLLLCGALCAPAALAVNVVIGDTTITVPEPPGYVDGSTVPSTLQVAMATTPKVNRLLGVLLQAEDKQRIEAKQPAQMKRYHLIQVNRKTEARPFSPELFAFMRQVFRDTAQQALERGRAEAEKEMSAHLERPSSDTAAGPVTVKLAYSGHDLYEETDTSLGYLTTIDVALDGGPDKVTMVVCTSLILIKDKILLLYTYFKKETPADVDAARETARAWMAAVVSANRLPEK